MKKIKEFMITHQEAILLIIVLLWFSVLTLIEADILKLF